MLISCSGRRRVLVNANATVVSYSVDVRTLMRNISLANPLWVAPRTHGAAMEAAIGKTRPA